MNRYLPFLDYRCIEVIKMEMLKWLGILAMSVWVGFGFYIHPE